MEIWSLTGVVTVLFVFYKFIKRLGNTIPVLELLLLIAGLQWIIGPIIEYNTPSFHDRYSMYVVEPIYMQYVVPAYLVFVCSILFIISKYSNLIISINSFIRHKKLAYVLLVVGLLSDFLGPILPSALSFFFYLLSNFKFVGAIILFFSNDKRLRIIFYFSILYLFYNSLQNALFHDFILWSIFFYMFWAIKYKPSIRTILYTIILGVLFLITLQSIKAAYRTEIWKGYSGNKIELFLGLVLDSIFSEGLFAEISEVNVSDTSIGNNVRLNQGWIISSIMDNIPQKQDFLEGETISNAIISSIFPRFLLPDKETAGGKKNFELFTGLQLGTNTSMGISIVGESYGNFGVTYGIVFMSFWGAFLALIWNRLFNFFLDNLVYLAFIPLIFLQVIKAETELVVVLNHLFKSLIVVFLFIFIYTKYSFNKSY